MEIIRAKVLGWCMGVKRAVDIAQQSLSDSNNKRSPGTVSTLGPLINNPDTVAELSKSGILSVDKNNILNKPYIKTAIISAHGLSPILSSELMDNGLEIIDATCPRVRASQKKAALLSKEGYQVIIVGDAGHSEVLGLAGYAPGAIIVESIDDVKKIISGKKLALIAQTTISDTEYQKIIIKIKEKYSDIKIVNSICPCTSERLEALEELTKKVEAIIVVGGKNSANTKRLYTRAINLGLAAWHIEKFEELPKSICQYDKIGITAGASTPEKQIQEIENKILNELCLA